MPCYCQEYSSCMKRKECQIVGNHGGVLAIIHPDFFQFSDVTQQFDPYQVKKLINLFAYSFHSNICLLDYGYIRAVERYPYNDKDNRRDFTVNITKAPTIPLSGVIGEFPVTAYEEAIGIVAERYADREIYIISPEPLSQEHLCVSGGKLFKNLIPFSVNEDYIQRLRIVEEQSGKHKNPQYNSGDTFCPIPEYMLTCWLERAVAKDNEGFFASKC